MESLDTVLYCTASWGTLRYNQMWSEAIVPQILTHRHTLALTSSLSILSKHPPYLSTSHLNPLSLSQCEGHQHPLKIGLIIELTSSVISTLSFSEIFSATVLQCSLLSAAVIIATAQTGQGRAGQDMCQSENEAGQSFLSLQTVQSNQQLLV